MCVEEFLTIFNSPSNYASWKPFSFYTSCQILSKNIDSFPSTFFFDFVSELKEKTISGLRIHILDVSDEFKYIYIFNFFETYFR